MFPSGDEQFYMYHVNIYDQVDLLNQLLCIKLPIILQSLKYYTTSTLSLQFWPLLKQKEAKERPEFVSPSFIIIIIILYNFPRPQLWPIIWSQATSNNKWPKGAQCLFNSSMAFPKILAEPKRAVFWIISTDVSTPIIQSVSLGLFPVHPSL